MPDPPITEDTAWEIYAKKIASVAHSYREDIDSGLYQMELIDAEGDLTDYGYKYVNACEKSTLGAYDEIPMTILRGATLLLGQYDVFLSTFFKYSNNHFAANFDAFTKKVGSKTKFDNKAYLNWMNDIFVNDLHMLKTTTLRAGGTRQPFQAEMAYLKNLDLIDKGKPYKIGTGLSINWPQVQSSSLYFQNL